MQRLDLLLIMILIIKWYTYAIFLQKYCNFGRPYQVVITLFLYPLAVGRGSVSEKC